jgi:hypothetical protein
MSGSLDVGPPAPEIPAIRPANDATRADGRGSHWLVGPWFDLLLIANVAWPLVLLTQFGEGFSGRDGLQFWQIYYVTTPHRWITLLIVLLDQNRVGNRQMLFLGIAGVVLAACATVQITTGTLTCLLAIDYIWNAWHFAAQHHGIYRIYERRRHGQQAPAGVAEKYLLRGFLLYVILRVATATWYDLGSLGPALQTADWLAILLPAWLVAKNIALGTHGSRGQTLYLISVCALFVALLLAVHFRQPMLILSLTLASALFHAIEYLTIVSWSTCRPNRGKTGELLAYLLPRWLLVLGVFVLVLGSCGYFLDQHWLRPWLFCNVVVAFLHYAYDGLIWSRGSSGAGLSLGSPYSK